MIESPRIGTAGWTIPAIHAAQFPSAGSHLARYAQRFNAVEINSSFYRPHRRATYQRWADTVPANFRFAVKMPRSITHAAQPADCKDLLIRFRAEIDGLADKLGVVLMQLPPRAAWHANAADRLLTMVARHIAAPLAIEPRHQSWFVPDAEAQMRILGVARVAADPPRGEGDGVPGGSLDLAYYRLHGAPRIYYSDYSDAVLTRLRGELARHINKDRDVWCIFDNTAAFAATTNALALQAPLD